MPRKSNGSNKINLPSPSTKRWVKSRKQAVLQAIDAGIITQDEACKTYQLSEEELQSWRHLTEHFGAEALRTTHLRRYRSLDMQGRESSFTENI